jgi:excisionase family DNA binding protein
MQTNPRVPNERRLQLLDPPQSSVAQDLAVELTEPHDQVDTLRGLPLLLTITEAARVLRISRTTAYKLADEWRRTGGAGGLRTVKLGSRILVRSVDLAEVVGVDPRN